MGGACIDSSSTKRKQDQRADWYDGYIEDGEMKVWLISDTHLNHGKMLTYCLRPETFTEMIWERWTQTVKPTDTIIHLGDVGIGNWRNFGIEKLPGRKILVRGNHDRAHSNTWWMEHGFDFSCDGLMFRHQWLTHEPSTSLASGCEFNVHGHLHNFDPEHHPEYKAKPFHRLLAVEYTDYRPVDFDKFIAQPDKFNARIHHSHS